MTEFVERQLYVTVNAYPGPGDQLQILALTLCHTLALQLDIITSKICKNVNG